MSSSVKPAPTEKERIESHTVAYFLPAFNEWSKSNFAVVEHGDAPDFVIRDGAGKTVYLEATLAEDRAGDIAVQLGRRAQRKPSTSGLPQGVDRADGEPLERLLESIKPKLVKDYGRDCALVVRQTSPVEWDWKVLGKVIEQRLTGARQPFNHGVWVVSLTGADVVKVL